MKKLSVLLAFSFVFFVSVIAQDVSTGNNWFIGAGARGNVWVNDDGSRYLKVWEKPSLGGELFVGKWFSHKVGARLFADGGSLHPFFQKLSWMEHQKYISGRVDFMLNFTNLFRSYSPDRFYNLIPYIGPGYTYSLDAKHYPNFNRQKGSITVGAGLLNTFRLSNNWNLYLNLGVDGMDAGFDGWKAEKPELTKSPSRFNYLASGSIGLIYNFGSAPKPVIVVPEPTPPPPPPAPVTPPPPPAPVVPTFEPVFFRLDKAIIDPDQQYKVQKVADYLNANSSAKVTVVGYADVKTGNPRYNLGISERRARAVAKQLTDKYGIDSSRIKLDWKGDTIQPFAENAKNRVVIFTN